MKYDIFYVSRGVINEDEWEVFRARFPIAQKIENVTSLNDIKKKSFTKMFWVVWDDVVVCADFDFNYDVPVWDLQYIHVFKNSDCYDGISLFPKSSTVSTKEFKHRVYLDKKEIEIEASIPRRYDQFIINTYEDYKDALARSMTDMFWCIWPEVEITEPDILDHYITHHNVYERNENHVFGHIFRGESTFSGGIVLCSKNKVINERELIHRFIIDRKEHTEIVSKVTPYDIVFISYNEVNADVNYKNLVARYPRAIRVDKVKGIHQAHITAAKLCTTEMIWIVDGDAEIVDEFNFDHEVSTYETDTVHVWRSQNPINDLVYGYGGVKLLPRTLTLNMDVSTPDMTTAISKHFRAVPDVSNVTAFNTDAFSTWRSAFRECVKLSSAVINRQKEQETQDRLRAWCTVGGEKQFGNDAITGALAGKEYGAINKGNVAALSKINDFNWLEQQWTVSNNEPK